MQKKALFYCQYSLTEINEPISPGGFENFAHHFL